MLVGEATFRATRQMIEYRQVAPVAAKGKAEPLLAWEAVAPGHVSVWTSTRVAHAQLVGREAELDTLRAALTRARSESSAQFVTLIGVPGIGKSRLIVELLDVVDTDSEIIWWRQGRCLPYGAAISFWALGEMAKAQAGVLETDSAEQAETKLREAVTTLVADPSEAEWVLSHMRPLLGLPRSRGRAKRALRSLAPLLRGARRGAAGGAGLRGPALGRRRAARLRRLPRRLGSHRAAADRLHGASRAARSPPRLGRGKRNATSVALSPLSDDDSGG